MCAHWNNTIENGNLDFAPAPEKRQSQEGFLEIVLRHRWIVLIIAILFLSAGFLYILTATPIYTSTSRLYVEQNGPKLISEYKGLMTQSKNYLYTQSELIKSTPIIANAVDDTQVSRLRTFASVDNLVAYLKKTLNVKVGKRDDIITVSLDSPYPREAAQIVNKVVNSYIGYHSSQKQSTVSEVLKILQREKVKRDKELSEKFERLLEFARVDGIVSFDDNGGHIVFQRLAKLSEALTEAQLTTINAKADYEATKRMASEPAKIKQFAMAQPTVGIRIFVNDAETQLRSELQDLQGKLKNARQHCTEEHPLVHAIQGKIDYIKEQLQSQAREFADGYIEVMRQRWATAKQREDELLASFNAQREEAQSLGVKATKYSVLQSELKRTERLCEILDERIKELNVTENAGALNISILEVARVKDKPSKPQKARVMAIVLVLGLLIGCGFAILRDWLDYRLHSAEEISAVLGIPVLGVVPTMSISEGQTIAARGQRIWLDFKAIAADTCQTIRAAVLPGIQTRKAKTIAATAPTTGEGRTTSGKQPILACSKKTLLKFKPILAKACRTVHPDVPSIVSNGEANTIDVTSPAVADSKATSRKQTSVQDSEKVWLKSQSSVAEAYQRRLASALFGAPKEKLKTIVVASPAPTDNKATSTKQTIAEYGQEVHLKPRSIVAEAYRTIRTAVFFGVPKDEARTILVTSPAPGDGKSTLVSNLAIAMAQAGQKTLVLDCDFRKPMQHDIFEIDDQKGLSSVFTGNITLDEAIRRGPVEGLDLLPCGPEVHNPSEILNSKVFVQALEDLSQQYDRVIIDSPPVGLVADSQILAAICDITLLVLRAEKSVRRRSRQARDCLLSVGGHLLGAIVNDVRRTGGRYGYYAGREYHNYGYYGYGHREKKKEHQQTSKPVMEGVAFENRFP